MWFQESSLMSNGSHEPTPRPSSVGFMQLDDREQNPQPAIIILDRATYVVSWDAAAEFLFGYPSSVAVGKPFYHFLELVSLTPGSVEWELQNAYYRGKSI